MTKIRKGWRQVLRYRKCMNFRFIRFLARSKGTNGGHSGRHFGGRPLRFAQRQSAANEKRPERFDYPGYAVFQPVIGGQQQRWCRASAITGMTGTTASST